MSQNFDETPCTRDRLYTPQGNAYLITYDGGMMITTGDENNPQNRDGRAYLEAICRISSKAMPAGVKKSVIAEQLRKAGVGRNAVLCQIADILERE